MLVATRQFEQKGKEDIYYTRNTQGLLVEIQLLLLEKYTQEQKQLREKSDTNKLKVRAAMTCRAACLE